VQRLNGLRIWVLHEYDNEVRREHKSLGLQAWGAGKIGPYLSGTIFFFFSSLFFFNPKKGFPPKKGAAANKRQQRTPGETK
jgi:hypothetical protein